MAEKTLKELARKAAAEKVLKERGKPKRKKKKRPKRGSRIEYEPVRRENLEK